MISKKNTLPFIVCLILLFSMFSCTKIDSKCCVECTDTSGEDWVEYPNYSKNIETRVILFKASDCCKD